MHKNNPFSKTVSNHSLLHTLEEKKNKAKLSKSSLSSALVRFTNGETWVCARGRSHNFYDFFLQHVSVCVWCFSKQKFSVFFSYVWSIIILHFIASRTFLGGFKSCHISHFFSYKNTCVSCLLVCVCVCVCGMSLESGFLCCLFCFCWCLGLNALKIFNFSKGA